MRNKLLKDLSDKDVKQGERAVTALGLLGSVGSAAVGLRDLNRVTKDEQRARNR